MVSIIIGVFPTIFLALPPMAKISLVFLFLATTEGSRTTIPLPLTRIKVLAVPKSMAMSEESKEKKESSIEFYFNTPLRAMIYLFYAPFDQSLSANHHPLFLSSFLSCPPNHDSLEL